MATMIYNSPLQLAALDDGGLLVVVDFAASGTGGLESLDDVQGGVVSDLAEDDVLAIEPGGDDGGDEELRAVGVWTCVGHGEEAWLGVLEGEVLVGELLSVDGLAAGAVALSKVTSLEHEVGDDAVEGRAGVAEALLASAESAEVLDGARDGLVEEVEGDAALLLLDLACLLALIEDWALPGNIEVDLLDHGCG